MVQMKSLAAHEYGGRQLQPGDVFEADDQYVDMLVAMKRAERCDGGTYTTRHLESGRGSSYNNRNSNGGSRRRSS